jgi:hypothetical protein
MLVAVMWVTPAGAAPSTADITQLAVGFRHTCALHADGAVSCWGDNVNGELGDGTHTRSAVPVAVAGLSDATAIAASGDRTCAIRRDSSMSCWGWIGGDTRVDRPTAIAASEIVQVAGPCMRDRAGAVRCFDQAGALQAIAGVNDAIAITATAHEGCAARASGSVACWFGLDRARPIPGVQGVIDVAIGGATACGRAASGAVTCWRWEQVPVPGSLAGMDPVPRHVAPGPRKLYPFGVGRVSVTAIALVPGGGGPCALTAANVVCWDRDRKPRVLAQADGSSVLALGGHSCAAHGGRHVTCWGDGGDGELGFGWGPGRTAPIDVPGVTDAVAIVASEARTCIRRRDGTAACWGASHATPQQAVWSDVAELHRGDCGFLHGAMSCAFELSRFSFADAVQTGAGNDHACALLRDGRITCTGRNVISPEPVAGISGATSYATSDFVNCAVRADHAVWCWSGPWKTALTESTGPSAWRYLSVPAKVIGLGDVTQIVMGREDFACALERDGTVWCFGENDVGQLGDGTFVTRSRPARVANLGGVIALAAGERHVCALRKTGTVACWGDGTSGQIGTYVTSAIPDPQAVIW